MFELWDSATGNRVGAPLETQEEALAEVRGIIALYGPTAPEVLDLGLLSLEPDQLIAAGPALVQLATAGL